MSKTPAPSLSSTSSSTPFTPIETTPTTPVINTPSTPVSTTPTTSVSTTPTTPTTPTSHTIYDIQGGVWPVGTTVAVHDVVITGVAYNGIYIQEQAGGEYSGIWVFMGTDETKGLSRGQVVSVEGTYDEYDDLSEIDAYTGVVTVTGSAAEPAAQLVTTATLADPVAAEPWEGVVVEVQGVTVVDGELDFGEWSVDDGLIVDDLIYDARPVYTGDTFASITGPLHYGYEAFKLEPRDAADLVGYASDVLPAEALGAGDLVITELMVNPSDCSDGDAEYVELYNATGKTVDLEGLVVADMLSSPTKWQIYDRTLIAPDTWFVGVSELKNNCYGLNAAFDFSFALSNTGDGVTVEGPSGTLIDVVDFSDAKLWPVPTGASMQLSASSVDATANDGASAWCDSTTVFGKADLGTPGAANLVCP